MRRDPRIQRQARSELVAAFGNSLREPGHAGFALGQGDEWGCGPVPHGAEGTQQTLRRLPFARGQTTIMPGREARPRSDATNR